MICLLPLPPLQPFWHEMKYWATIFCPTYPRKLAGSKVRHDSPPHPQPGDKTAYKMGRHRLPGWPAVFSFPGLALLKRGPQRRILKSAVEGVWDEI